VFVLEVLVAVAVLATVALLAAGRFDGLADESPDDPDVGIPADRPLRSSDVPQLRFRLAIRGYRMSDVDAAMQAVQEALREAEARPERSETPEKPLEPTPPPAPAPPLEPTPLPPPAPPPLQPEPVPTPEPPVGEPAAPAEVPTADQPPTDAEDRPLSDLEAETAATPAEGQPSSAAASWRMPTPPGD
jgi:DivIVA domain-containing protein